VGSWSTGALIGVFVVAAAATWVAGVVLSDATDVIDNRFDLGEALGGMILLGFAGTLPELAVTASAAVHGNLDLAAGNLLGGIAMQTLVLVLIDAVSRSETPLSSMSKVLEPIFEALLVVLVVAIALMGPLLPETVSIGAVSPVSIMIVVAWLLGMLGLKRIQRSEHWESVEDTLQATVVAPHPGPVKDVRPNRFASASTRTTVIGFGVAALVTLVAGVALEQSGDGLANAWGINGVIFGATILAAVTALPEISTGIRAVRLGKVGLAMGDIFGGNSVQITLFLLADILAGKPVLTSVSNNSMWLGGMGLVVTAIFATGLLFRPRRKVLGLGPDSWFVLVAYLLGIWGLLYITN
jgi:cation:H+ antiporter